MSWDQAQQYVRIIGYAAAGWMASRGYINQDQVDMIGGAILAIGALSWTIAWNWKRPDAK